MVLLSLLAGSCYLHGSHEGRLRQFASLRGMFKRKKRVRRVFAYHDAPLINCLYRDMRIFFSTVWAEISRLAASGMTMLLGLSITSSDTIMLRRTGRQCMK